MTTHAGWPEDAVSGPVSHADAVSGTSWSADETQGLTEAQKGSTVQDDWRAALAAALVSFGIDYQQEAADALLPTVRRIVAAELRDFADLIDRGPTFPLPPSIFSAMARERADDLAALDATPDHGKA